MSPRGKAGRRQRSRQEIAVMYRQPYAVAVARVEVGMRREKGLRLHGGRVGKTIDIVMTVALGMGDADQCTKREVLLDAKAGLTGQVLARYEESFAARAPFGGAGRIDDRLVDPLAGFGGDAAIAERARRRKCVVRIVRLVDDEIALRKRAKRRLPGDLARHRLLDVLKLCHNRRQRAVAVETMDQCAQGCEVGILLVGIQRDVVVVWQRGELLADPDQARRVLFGIAVELELEIARAGIFTCVGDTTGTLDLVVETDSMSDRDALEPLPSSEKPRNVLIPQIGSQTRIDPGDILLHAVEEIRAGRTH